MHATKQKMVTAVFRNRYDAERAFDALRTRGYNDRDINVLMSDQTRASFAPASGRIEDRDEGKHEAGSMAEEGMGIGGAIGTTVGATLAAIAAVGTSIAIPGLGLVIAGPIAAALAGGGAGAVAGGVVGALIGYGIPEANAEAYHQALRDGGVVIGVVPRNQDESSKIKQIFEDVHGESVCCC